MASLIPSGSASGTGSMTLAAPVTNSNQTITLPDSTGTIALTSQVLGVGQTWTDVTSSRAIGTTYTNSTGKPIMVIVSGTGGGANGLWGVTLNSAITFYTPSTYTTSVWTTACFIVPNGNTYALSQQGSSATMANWSELR